MRSLSVVVLTVILVTSVHGQLDEAVEGGIAYFREKCTEQLSLLEDLNEAVGTGLDEAKNAYVLSRPPYEQIEVLALNFEEQDREIDARPDAFELGEDDPEWKGFHRIERALYRDEDLNEAQTYTTELVASTQSLCDVLSDVSNFDPQSSFEGMMGLALEVPAKKISSEEETWSDQSVLIFRENYKGIWSQYMPFSSLMSSEIAADMNKSYSNLRVIIDDWDPAGFDSDGPGAAYSSISIPRRKTLQEEAYRFVVALERAATAVLASTQTAKVRGTHGLHSSLRQSDQSGAQLSSATDAGRKYFLAKCEEQQVLLDDLIAAIEAEDLDLARMQYGASRQPYEQIETLADNFEEEDKKLDARPYAFDRGELDEEWQGFHRVERALFRDNNLNVALDASMVMIPVVESLCSILADESGSNFKWSSTWDGIEALSVEVPAKKISSEEETMSDLSLMIFRENLKGIHSQYRPFAELLTNDTAEAVQKAYDSLRNLYADDIDEGNGFNDSNFRLYSEVSIPERKKISDMAYEYAAILRTARSEIEGMASSQPSPSVEPSSTDGPDDDGVCFPADALVELPHGRQARMDELEIGDHVRVRDAEYAPIIFFSHRDASVFHSFVQLTLEAGRVLTLTLNHYVPLATGVLRPAGSLVVGEALVLGNNEIVRVESIAIVRKRGLFAPHTSSGQSLIVVNGVLCSEFTSFVHPAIARVLIAPLRWASVFGVVRQSIIDCVLTSGREVIRKIQVRARSTRSAGLW